MDQPEALLLDLKNFVLESLRGIEIPRVDIPITGDTDGIEISLCAVGVRLNSVGCRVIIEFGKLVGAFTELCELFCRSRIGRVKRNCCGIVVLVINLSESEVTLNASRRVGDDIREFVSCGRDGYRAVRILDEAFKNEFAAFVLRPERRRR